MSITEYFQQHEEQAFVAKAIATAIAIILAKNFLAGLLPFLVLIFPVVFLLFIRMHAATSGRDTMDLLREHITFFPIMRTEGERRTEVTPWVTYGIILANVLIFYLFELNVPPEVIGDHLVFLPHRPNPLNVPLSALTSIFLHASNGHLWGNMTFLWVVGSAVERRVGRKTFSWLYLVTGLLGGLIFILVEFVSHGRVGHSLGASGAIAGIMGIFAVRCYFKSMIFPLPILGIFSLILPISLKIRLNSLAIMALFFLSDFSGGIAQVTGQSDSMIAHWAHLGGMISGMLLAGFLKLGEEAVEERHLEIGLKASEAAYGYAGGERSLQIALERNPDNIDALLALARLKTKFQNTPEGQELYEKTLGLMLKGRPAGVTEVFCEYYRKYRTVPTEQWLVSRLAEILRTAGEIDLCMRCLERLVDLPDTPPAEREKGLFQLATLLEFSSCFEAAQSCFARFAAEYPDSLLAGKAREKAGNEVHRTPRPAAAAAPAATTNRCPACGTWMTIRTATSGPRQGERFRVCTSYPDCPTILPMEPAAAPEAVAEPIAPGRYCLVFAGALAPQANPERTRDNLAQLLRCDRERIERLFGGRRTVLKKGLEQGSAMKMKEAFDRTGAICVLEPEEAPIPAPAPAQEQTPAAPAPAFSCPKCGKLQKKGELCLRCGVVFAKLVAQVSNPAFALESAR